MKVHILPRLNSGFDGIYRVLEGQHAFLPSCGIEIVNSVEEADVVNVHIADIPKNLAYDKPLVVSNHGLYWEGEDWPKWARKLNRKALEAVMVADVVTAPSEFVRNALQRGTLKTVRKARHGIDLNQWEPKQSEGFVLWNKSRHDLSCDSTQVNHLAQMDRSIPYVTTFGQDAPNVTVTGRISPEKMKQLVQIAGVYLDTPRESGGPCFGVLEALACGVPVLSWDYGGTSEVIVSGETGYLAEVGNYDDLYNGLQYCLQNRQRLSDNARELAKQYRWETVIRDYVEAYKEAIHLQNRYTCDVSVIMPVYNMEQYVAESIQSVLNSSYKSWECIVIDDASTDSSPDILEKMSDIDPRISIYKNEVNLHVAQTRNEAIKLASGRYILPLDSDDCLTQSGMEILVSALKRDRSLFIASGSLNLVRENGKAYKGEWPTASHISFTDVINGHNPLPYCSMYKREVWENLGGYRRRIRSGVEDADFWTRAMSFGYRGQKVTENPVINYRLVPDSLSRRNEPENWLEWYIWSYYPPLRPFGSYFSDNGTYDLEPHAYETDISVVIPVGPNHASYIQTCLDSLVNQTFQNFEVILVNDTGYDISDFVLGFPFVKIVDDGHNHGSAWARNRGFEAASSEFVVLLDVDDYAQPYMLEALYKAITFYDNAYIYSDWYADSGDKVYIQESRDFNPEKLKLSSIFSITGAYRKSDWKRVGGFDEHIPGWEDWDYHLRLLENCICGVRIEYPLFTYRYTTGRNRETSLTRRTELIDYIKKNHKELYKGEFSQMGCSSCGRRNVSLKTASKNLEEESEMGTVLFEYIGNKINNRTIKSRAMPGHFYRFGGNQRIIGPVYDADVHIFDNNPLEFKRVQPKPKSQEKPDMVLSEPVTVQKEETKEPPKPVPIDKVTLVEDTDLDESLVKYLKNGGFITVAQVKRATDDELLDVGGIGKGRLETIRSILG